MWQHERCQRFSDGFYKMTFDKLRQVILMILKPSLYFLIQPQSQAH
jgi:hypothetical protein